MSFNLDQIELILVIFVFLLLIFAGGFSRTKPSTKSESPRREPTQIRPDMNDFAKVDDIANLVSFMLRMQREQQSLKAEIEKLLAHSEGTEKSLKAIQDSTDKFDRILFDPQAKGALGEKFVADQLSVLPQDWIKRNVPFRNDTRVEFCIRASDGRLIPIDSKWPATPLLDKLGQTTDKAERAKIERAIKNEVWKRGLEVGKYIDDDRTLGFGIAAVPDSVFALCSDVQPYLAKSKIVLISYSLLVPYILVLVKLFLSNAQGIQAMQISQILYSSIIEIEQIQELIDTDLRKPLDTIKQQQTEFRSQGERLQAVNSRLIQIQNELNFIKDILPTGISTLPNSEISSIPDQLKHRVDELRKSLIENRIKQNGHIQNDVDEKPVE